MPVVGRWRDTALSPVGYGWKHGSVEGGLREWWLEWKRNGMEWAGWREWMVGLDGWVIWTGQMDEVDGWVEGWGSWMRQMDLWMGG